MSELDGTQKATSLQRPTRDNKIPWKEYWKAQGQPWRTEPEISKERQEFLDERRIITPYIDTGLYPFKDVDPKLRDYAEISSRSGSMV